MFTSRMRLLTKRIKSENYAKMVDRNKHTMRRLYRPTSLNHQPRQPIGEHEGFKDESKCRSLESIYVSTNDHMPLALNHQFGVWCIWCENKKLGLTLISYEKTYELMTDAGLIQISSTGSYHFLPIAHKSVEKLTQVIDRFMEASECSKMAMTLLTPAGLWESSGRASQCSGELMEVFDRQRRKYILSPTHEEAICELVGYISPSYRQLPIRLYQIGSKFRDEVRPKHGLLRAREFLMKDLYCFDADKESSKITYDAIVKTYEDFFNYIGIPWVKALASSGTMGGDCSHEFLYPCSVGEDQILNCSNCNGYFNIELLRKTQRTETNVDEFHEETKSIKDLVCPNCGGGEFTSIPAIEVGQTFLLGQKYTSTFDVKFRTPSGSLAPLEMGCYGLGVSRILASAIEILSTSDQIRWPLPLAPYLFAVVPPKSGSKEELLSTDLMTELTEFFGKNLPNDVIWDDRTEHTIGRRLSDLVKLGIPYLVVLGKGLTNLPPTVEIRDIYNGTVRLVPAHDIRSACHLIITENLT